MPGVMVAVAGGDAGGSDAGVIGNPVAASIAGAGSVNPDSAILELELKRCLQVTWVANNRGDRSDLRRANRGVRVTELWMVEEIECLRAELAALRGSRHPRVRQSRRRSRLPTRPWRPA